MVKAYPPDMFKSFLSQIPFMVDDFSMAVFLERVLILLSRFFAFGQKHRYPDRRAQFIEMHERFNPHLSKGDIHG